MKNKKSKNFIDLFFVFILTFTILFTSQGLLVFAEEDESEEEKEELLDEYEENEKKIEKYNDILNLKQKEREVINAQIKNIENESVKVAEEIEENEEEIEELSSDINRIKTEIQQKETHISLQKRILEKFIREKYQNYTQNTETFTMLNIANSNAQNHKDNLTHATGGVGEFIKKIHTEQAELKKDQTNLEKKTDRIEDAKYELEQRSAHLKDSQNYKQVLAAEVAAEEDKYQKKLSKLEREQLEIQQEISSLSNGYVGDFSLADLPDANDADFDMPVSEPYVVTQGYGVTSFSHNYSTGTHNGIDYVAQGSQNIRSVADGKVKATGDMGRYGYGKWVAIDHDNGLVTLYGHLSSIKVDRGDKIDQGDKIGTQGSTGFSTGTHLHFSVFAETTFEIVESSSVDGIYIPTGATVNPGIYL